MNKQVALDTETTGIKVEEGHRIIEIGCVEIIDRLRTGNEFHCYLNPQRKVDQGAFSVHGISDDFLKDKPLFSDVVSDFLKFIENSELIIHNAKFDLGFLNFELRYLDNFSRFLIQDKCKIIDTLELARSKFPRQRNNLDALCKRYNIVGYQRDLHGALLDANILADLYLSMTGVQVSLDLSFISAQYKDVDLLLKDNKEESYKDLSIIEATGEEIKLHEEYMQELLI